MTKIVTSDRHRRKDQKTKRVPAIETQGTKEAVKQGTLESEAQSSQIRFPIFARTSTQTKPKLKSRESNPQTLPLQADVTIIKCVRVVLASRLGFKTRGFTHSTVGVPKDLNVSSPTMVV